MKQQNRPVVASEAERAERLIQHFDMHIEWLKEYEQKRKAAKTECTRTRWQTEERQTWNIIRSIAHSILLQASQNMRALTPEPKDDEDNEDWPL